MGNKCNKQQSESEALRTRIGICPAEVNRLLQEQKKDYEKKCKEYMAKARLDNATSVRRQVETAQDAYVHLLPIRRPAQNTQATQTVHTTLSAQASQIAHATQSACNTPSGHTTQSAQASLHTSFPAQNAQSELNAQSAQNAQTTQSVMRIQIPDLQAMQSSLEHLRNALHVLTSNVPATQSAQITQNLHAVQGAHFPQTAHNVANVQAAQTAPNVQSTLHAHTDKNVLTTQETQIAQNVKTPQSSQGHLFTHKHGTQCIFTQTEQIAKPVQSNKDALQAQFTKSTLAAQIDQKLVIPQISQAAQNEQTVQSAQTHEKPNVTQKAPLTNLPHSHFIYNSNQNAKDKAPWPKLLQNIQENGRGSTGDKKGIIPFVKRAQDTPDIDRNSQETVCTGTARSRYTNVNNREKPSPQRSFNVYRSEKSRRNHNHKNCSTDKMTFGLNIYECNDHHNSYSDCKEEHRPDGICVKTLKNSGTQKDVNGRTEIVPCPHSNEGCVLHFRESEMNAHIQECPYQELSCPTGCLSKLRLKQLSSHFKALHPEKSLLKIGTEIQLRDIDKNSQNVNLVFVDNKHFLLYVLVSASKRKIYMAVQIVSTKFSASKLCYEIHLYNGSDGRSFKFADSCTSYFEPVSNIVKEGKCCVITHAYAYNLVKEGVLTYKFFIKKSFYEN